MTFDVGAIEEASSYTLEPVFPNGEKMGVSITVIGLDHEKAQTHQRRKQDRRLAQMQKKNKKALTSAELEEDATELLAVCTLSWEGVTLNGEPMECTFENAKWLYAQTQDPRIAELREQVDQCIGDRANFLRS